MKSILSSAVVLALLLPLSAQQSAESVPAESSSAGEILPGGSGSDSGLLGSEQGESVLPAAPVEEETGDPTAPIARALVRISAAIQPHSYVQPWQRVPLQRRSSLGVALESGKILTTAASVMEASFVELQAASGGGRIGADVVAMDLSLNLALLQPRGTLPFIEALQPVALVDSLELGDELELWQLEVTGQFSKTEGKLSRGTVVGYPGPLSSPFLSGELRMVVQTRPNSQAAPMVRDGKLAGLLMDYDARQQTARMLPVDLIYQFLNDLADGQYAGRATLDFDWLGTEDSTFREWLGLPADIGGVYVSELPQQGGAIQAGLQQGDVLTAVEGEPVDARGYVNLEGWGRVNFSHLILGTHTAGESVNLSLWRNHEQVELSVTLPRVEPWQKLIPNWLENRGPNYLILGGAVLQELTIPYLAEARRVSDARAIEIAHIAEDPDSWLENHDRVVVWCYAIPTPATFGYERLDHLVIETVNGQIASDLGAVAAAIDAIRPGELIELGVRGEPDTIYLDPVVVSQVNTSLAEQGLVPLHRIDPYGPATETTEVDEPSTPSTPVRPSLQDAKAALN